MLVAVGATENVGLDVRVRVDVNERDLDAVSVRVDPWIQMCVEVRVAVYVFVGASENEGLTSDSELMSMSETLIL